jgi:hypothetical protein
MLLSRPERSINCQPDFASFVALVQAHLARMALAFPDQEAERAFQLSYGWPGCAVGLGAAVMGILVHGLLMLQALLLHDARALTTPQIWHAAVSIATGFNFTVMYAVLGRERFIRTRGVQSIWHRLCTAAGVLYYSRPGDCAAAGYCRLLWQHRLLPIHVFGALGRNTHGLYWAGGIVSWLVAVAVDVVDPNVTCECVVCVPAALQAQAADNPKLLLLNILSTLLRSSRVLLLMWCFLAC